MNIKIIRHLTAAHNKPAVEYERVNLWGETERGISLTDGLEGQALLDAIEKDCIIGDNFTASATETLEGDAPPGSLAWRMNAEAGTLKYPPPLTEPEDSRPSKASKPAKPPVRQAPKPSEPPARQTGGLSAPAATPAPLNASGK